MIGEVAEVGDLPQGELDLRPQLALDLAQDTFRIAIEKLRRSPIEQVERVAGYLRATALNRAGARLVGVSRRGPVLV